ncbi:MAG: metallophosphoesterase [Halobacteriales archaeon]|nr:metallophosphoesterase [Halobacteriales archaeon]
MHRVNSDAVVARLTAPKVESRTRIAVVADPHVTPRAEGTAMVYHRAVDRLRTALMDAERRNVDAIISAGDLTKDGAPWEYEQLDQLLTELETPFFSVPGNHDVPKASTDEYEHGDDHDTPPIDQFERKYAPDSYPFVEEVGELDIVALNTASRSDGSLRRTHDGAVSDTDITWLEKTLPELETPVVLMHHNTPAMYEQFRTLQSLAYSEMDLPPIMRDPEPLMEVLTEQSVPLVITGHLHNVGIAQTGPAREITTPATGSFPQAYLIFEFDTDGTVIRYIPVADIEGMTEAHYARLTGGDSSAGYTAFAAIRLASLPLLDEQQGSL